MDTSDISGLNFLHLLLQLGAGCQRSFVVAAQNVTAHSLPAHRESLGFNQQVAKGEKV